MGVGTFNFKLEPGKFETRVGDEVSGWRQREIMTMLLSMTS